MKKNYKSKLSLSLVVMMSALFMSHASFSQRVVTVDDGAILSDIINGDTLDNGDRVDANTIYELKMNGLYYLARELNIGSKLHIRSEGGDGWLPAIFPQKDANDAFPKAINNKGDIILEGIYLSNQNGEDANPKWGGFRATGEGSTVSFTNCQFEFDKGATLMLFAKDINVTIENCTAAKTGNYKEYNGNGRLIDTRGNGAESIVIKNTTVYYMQDRLIRNMGGVINNLEIDHVTVVNNQGFHGVFAMAKVHHAKITNNLVIDAMYGGDHPNTSEQTSSNPDDNLKIYMITMDTVYEDSELEISNNNIAFTQPVLDFFNSIDSVNKPEVLAPSVAAFLGDAAADAYFEEAITFNNMPDVPWDFLTSIYTDPSAQHPSNWPDEIGIANIDAGYSTSSTSATASTTGGPIGDLRWMGSVGVSSNTMKNNNLQVNVYPNPVTDFATISVELSAVSDVELSVFDITGKIVFSNELSGLNAGTQSFKWDASSQANGLYLYTINAEGKTSSGKITLNK